MPRHSRPDGADRPGDRTVSVKMSSWPTAQDSAALIDTIRAFVAAGRHLAGLAGDVRSVRRPYRNRRGPRARAQLTFGKVDGERPLAYALNSSMSFT